MKAIFLLLFITLLHPQSNTGNGFPKGCYMSFEEIRTKTPSGHSILKIEKRDSKAEILFLGNDWQITSANNSISKSKIQSEVWAYCNDTDLYINCKKLKKERQPAFAKVITYGRYLGFYRNELSEKARDAAMLGAFLGGAAGSAIALSSVQDPIDPYLYVIDTKTAKLFWVDSLYMTKILKDKPELYTEFIQYGAKANDNKVQLQFLELLNRAE